MAQTTPPPITPTPTPAIQRADRNTFSDRLDAFILWLVAAVAQFQALAGNVYDNAVDAFNSAVSAAASAVTAATQASAAISGVNAIAWVSGTTYTDGQSRYSPIDRRTYRRVGGGAGTTDPSVDTNNWVLISSAPTTIPRSARTANAVLGALDARTFVDITANSFTQTFTAAATLGAGWYCYLRNSGAGDITLDPNGVELIDGLSSFIMYPGETRLVQGDGAGFTSIVISPFVKTFLASATFVKAPGYLAFDLEGMSGGGGGGAGARAPNNGSDRSGGSGAYAGLIGRLRLAAANVAPTEPVIIGAGATGAPGRTTDGGTLAQTIGGTTSFGPKFFVSGATGPSSDGYPALPTNKGSLPGNGNNAAGTAAAATNNFAPTGGGGGAGNSGGSSGPTAGGIGGGVAPSGASGRADTIAGAAAGANGASAFPPIGGLGGGGGSYAAASNGMSGGDGGFPGGAGGGGSAVDGAFTSGKGGNGAAGFLTVSGVA